MFFAQGRDFSGQNPDEFNAVLRRAGNKVVVPVVRHSIYGCVLPVHDFNIPFLPRKSNQVVTPNAELSCSQGSKNSVESVESGTLFYNLITQSMSK